MTDIKLRHCDKWSGTHRGVSFQVSRHHVEATEFSPARDCWAHYVFLHEGAVPADMLAAVFLEKAPGEGPTAAYSYMSSWLADLAWPGGITFYEYTRDAPGLRAIQAGCDYSHSWDEGRVYNVQYVAREAHLTIDSLWTAMPGLLVRCWRTGDWIKPPKEDAARGEP